MNGQKKSRGCQPPASLEVSLQDHATSSQATSQGWIEPTTFAEIIRIARDRATALDPAENRLVAEIAITPSWLHLSRWKIMALETINSKLRVAAGGGA